MRVNPNGTVMHQKGEPVPVWCECGTIYQPLLGDNESVCPHCGRKNVHDHCPRVGLILGMVH